MALALSASAFSIGATGAFADTVAPVNNGGDASAPPGCPLGTVRDASGKICTASSAPARTTTTTATTAPTATASTAAGTTTASVAGTTSGTTASSAGTGAALANTGTPVTPLLLGLIMLALGGLIVLRTRTTA